jgi:hypothetical protein
MYACLDRIIIVDWSGMFTPEIPENSLWHMNINEHQCTSLDVRDHNQGSQVVMCTWRASHRHSSELGGDVNYEIHPYMSLPVL